MVAAFSLAAALALAIVMPPPDLNPLQPNGEALGVGAVRESLSSQGETTTSEASASSWEYAQGGVCILTPLIDDAWGPGCVTGEPELVECLAGPTEVRWVWRRDPDAADPSWFYLGTAGCSDDAALLAAIEREWTSLTPEPSTVTLQPPDGVVYATVPTIAMAGAETRVHQATILGAAVTIEATPVEYTWDWGDGAVTTTTDPGAPYPHHTVSHTYGHATDGATVALTTTWEGRWRVGGGVWRDFDSTVQSQSPPTSLDVLHPRAVLVD